MNARKYIDMAGGPNSVAIACSNRGMDVNRHQVSSWKSRNRFPVSEWTGKTSVAEVVCELIEAMGRGHVEPLEICPGAGQYMKYPDSEAA